MPCSACGYGYLNSGPHAYSSPAKPSSLPERWFFSLSLKLRCMTSWLSPTRLREHWKKGQTNRRAGRNGEWYETLTFKHDPAVVLNLVEFSLPTHQVGLEGQTQAIKVYSIEVPFEQNLLTGPSCCTLELTTVFVIACTRSPQDWKGLPLYWDLYVSNSC